MNYFIVTRLWEKHWNYSLKEKNYALEEENHTQQWGELYRRENHAQELFQVGGEPCNNILKDKHTGTNIKTGFQITLWSYF